MFKKRIFLIITLVFLLVTLTVSVTAFLTAIDNVGKPAEIGFVEVEVYPYFQRGDSEDSDDFKEIDMSTSSGGVVSINVNDNSVLDDLEHFSYFKVKIKIKSNVKTYFRIAMYEQLTLSYEVGDQTIEIATTRNKYAPFNYNEYYGDGREDDNGRFYDNRMHDGFFYYINDVERNMDGSALEINFINQAIELHDVFPSRYTLKIGFIIEAVQSLHGPQINWGLATPPWPPLGTNEDQW